MEQLQRRAKEGFFSRIPGRQPERFRRTSVGPRVPPGAANIH